MHNILVTGANGQVGSELRALQGIYPDYNLIFTDVQELDITFHQQVEKFLADNAITVIINCAAYTAVDKAETETEKANAINHLAVENLAKLSKSRGIILIHISTDYVFDGMAEQPYTETDTPNPQSVYGKTKLEGEKALQIIEPENAIIVRTSWLYSSYGSNFVKTMLRLGKEKSELRVISDQVGSPTYAHDLARTILELLPKLKHEGVAIYHYTNEGSCSWYDFARAIFEIKEMSVKLIPIKTAEYPKAATRPHYSVLDKTKISSTFKLELANWKDSLGECLKKIEIKKPLI